MPRTRMSHVVVLLPGITGSVLQKDGKDVWAMTPGAVLQALRTLGRSIQDLALTGDPADVDDLGDGITATRIMPDTHLIPGLWKIDGYSRIARAIQDSFEVERGENYFEFAYDWRRDNRVAARMLARNSHDWLRAWRDRSGNDAARLILVAHSMGGLVARHFLELLEGWAITRMLVTFGTPYRGSLNALNFIANGMAKKLGPITVMNLSELLRSFTSVYQLLPVYPCFEAEDGRMVRVSETTIPNLDPKRTAAALTFHQEIREAVEKHRQEDAYLDHGYRIHPVVGIFQPTWQSARRDGDGVRILRQYGGEDQGGDGTVPRVSATPLELSNQGSEMYVADRHAWLQNADPVLTQLWGLLSGDGWDFSAYYALHNIRLSLDLDDVYLTDEPVAVRVRAEEEGVPLTASVEDIASGLPVRRADMRGSDEAWQVAEFAPLPAGMYRVTIRGESRVDPVSDVFAVVGGPEADD